MHSDLVSGPKAFLISNPFNMYAIENLNREVYEMRVTVHKKDEELLEAFERVERFVDYQYRKGHGNLYFLVGVYLFLLVLISGYWSEIPNIIHVSPGLLIVIVFIPFVPFYILFGEKIFHVASRAEIEKMGKKEASIKKKNRLSHVVSFLTLVGVLVCVYCAVSFLDISFYTAVCGSVGLGNIISFLTNQKIYGDKYYHRELLWVGLMLLLSVPVVYVMPVNPSAVTAFVFLGSYSAVAFHIRMDAETLLKESIIGNLGRLLSSESKLSSPVRLGIMILLRIKRRMVFSEIQKMLKLTPGNLDSHLKHLEKSGYVRIRKVLSLRGPRTVVEMTPAGEEALSRHILRMKLALSCEEI
jgi:DNA-binding MarR family transcriptional regulator